MLAKVIGNRSASHTGHDDFAARIDYIAIKASHAIVANLTGGWRDAATQMQFSAGLNPHIRSPAYHFVLSWAETERPSDRQMIIAARKAVEELGGSEHQYVVAIHRDRPCHHVHVLLNRIHPVSGKCLPTSHDYARLERACRQIEQQMGWPADRGRFEWVTDGDDIQPLPRPASHWQQKVQKRALGLRRDSDSMRKQAHTTGLPSILDILPASILETLRNVLRLSAGWQEVHRSLRHIGFRYMRYRSGARITCLHDKWFIPASNLGTAFGLGWMQARLGVYEPEHHHGSSRGAGRNIPWQTPTTTDSPTSHILSISPVPALLQPLQERRKRMVACQNDRAARQELIATQNEEVQRVRTLMGDQRTPWAIALRHAMHDAHQSQHRALRSTQESRGIRPPSILAQIERAQPAKILRRRYAHILRETISASPSSPRPPVDHTALRQAWCMSGISGKTPSAFPTLQAKLAPYIKDMRLDRDRFLLIAHRNLHNSVIGFSRLDLASPDQDDRLATVGKPGLVILGSEAADHCLVMTEVTAAVTRVLAHEGPPRLQIVTGSDPATLDAEHILNLAHAKQVQVIVTPADIGSGLLARLAALLPTAKFTRSREITTGGQPKEREAITATAQPKPEHYQPTALP